MEKPAFISSNTWVPVGAIVVAASMVAGGAFWLSAMYSEQRHNTEQIQIFDQRLNRVEVKQNTQELFQSKTEERLKNIENLLTEVRDTVKTLTAQPSSRTNR